MHETLISIREALNVLPDAVVVIDINLEIIATNEQTFTLFGYHPEELVGQKLYILIPKRYHKKNEVHFADYFRNPEMRRMGTAGSLFGVKKDGSEIDVDVALAPLVADNRQLVIASIRDITALRELERHLLKKNEELSLTNTQLERFGYVIAHDLKSPLLNLHAIIRLMKRELPDDKNEKLAFYAAGLDDSLVTMMDLIKGVADYSRASLHDIVCEPVDLNHVMTDVRKLVHLPQNFNLCVCDQLPVIEGNKTKIIQVFLNLINNAVKFNDKPEGKIEIHCKSNTKVCLISIADNGPGVPVELRTKIFELFKRGNIEREDSQGIGLAVVKKIIEDRGGSIMVDTSHLGGADFIITFPAYFPIRKEPATDAKAEKPEPVMQIFKNKPKQEPNREELALT